MLEGDLFLSSLTVCALYTHVNLLKAGLPTPHNQPLDRKRAYPSKTLVALFSRLNPRPINPDESRTGSLYGKGVAQGDQQNTTAHVP